jgi:hypothetical protein
MHWNWQAHHHKRIKTSRNSSTCTFTSRFKLIFNQVVDKRPIHFTINFLTWTTFLVVCTIIAVRYFDNWFNLNKIGVFMQNID